MNYFFITGTSRGIGEALKNQLLKNPKNVVLGTSRSQIPASSNYQHFITDLSVLSDINKLSEDFFSIKGEAEKLVLINNAGTIGEVGHLGEIKNDELAKLYLVNVIAPVILLNTFISRFKNDKAEKIVMNMSSGAAYKPKDGWAGYCSSKAALDMASKVCALENDLIDSGVKIFSVAPGIVDTQMQSEIRKVNVQRFSEVQRFKQFKENGDLSDPAATAEKLLNLIENASRYSEVLQDVRNL